MSAPPSCPNCGEYKSLFSYSKGWHEVPGAKRKSGYSMGKGIVGGL